MIEQTSFPFLYHGRKRKWTMYRHSLAQTQIEQSGNDFCLDMNSNSLEVLKKPIFTITHSLCSLIVHAMCVHRCLCIWCLCIKYHIQWIVFIEWCSYSSAFAKFESVTPGRILVCINMLINKFRSLVFAYVNCLWTTIWHTGVQ